MKKLLAGAALAGLAFGIGGEAQAALFNPTPGPIFFQFTNLEQVDTRTVGGAPVNGINCGSGCSEGNWGIAQLSVFRKGVINGTGIGNDIDNAGTPPQFVDQVLPTLGGQITAMFYGIQQTSITQSGSVLSLKSNGGFIDLYYDDPSLAGTTATIGSATPGGRTSQSTFTNFTDGVFLARLAFASGINTTDANVFIQGTIDTALQNNSGSADSYAVVADVNGDGKIDGLDGAWASFLNTDFFNTVFGTRDVRFSNKIDINTSWNGDPGIIGLTSNDPGRAFAIPEPVTLGLMGSGLVFLGLGGRRRRSA